MVDDDSLIGLIAGAGVVLALAAVRGEGVDGVDLVVRGLFLALEAGFGLAGCLRLGDGLAGLARNVVDDFFGFDVFAGLAAPVFLLLVFDLVVGFFFMVTPVFGQVNGSS
jgi:hypothetical protein